MARSLTDRPADEAGARPPLRLLTTEPEHAEEHGEARRALEARRLHPAAAHLAAQGSGPAAPARLRVVPAVAS